MDRQEELTLAVWTREYVGWLETAITQDVCRCAWIDSGRLSPSGKRLLTISHAHPLCQVHTKEGRIVGFLVWASEHKGLSFTLDPGSLLPIIDLVEFPATVDNEDAGYRQDLHKAIEDLPNGQLTLEGVFLGLDDDSDKL